jgi:hypothetical protein
MTRLIRALQVSLNLRSDNSTQCIRSGIATGISSDRKDSTYSMTSPGKVDDLPWH